MHSGKCKLRRTLHNVNKNVQILLPLVDVNVASETEFVSEGSRVEAMAVQDKGVSVSHLVMVGAEIRDPPDESSVAEATEVGLETGFVGQGEGAI